MPLERLASFSGCSSEGRLHLGGLILQDMTIIPAAHIIRITKTCEKQLVGHELFTQLTFMAIDTSLAETSSSMGFI